MTRPLPRSFLYVPGDSPDLFAKAARGPADAVVLDLEDAVPVHSKSQARLHVREWLTGTGRGLSTGPENWVRVSPQTLTEDLAPLPMAALDGVFLAKCTFDSLEKTTRLLGELDAPGAGRRPVRVVGLIESAQGLLELTRTAQHPRLTSFGIGETDLLGDLRMARNEGTAAVIDQLRTRIVIACAGYGLSAPVAPTSTAFRDLDGFRTTTRHLRDLGFRSRTAIHPGQIPIIHEMLTPAHEDVASARDVIERFEAARGGVTTGADGHLIDAAVVRGAWETLERYEDANRPLG